MEYIRTFYPQEKDFEVKLKFKNDIYNQDATFGLSGANSLNFFCFDDLIHINDTFCSNLDDDGSTDFTVCGSSGNVTVWKKGSPIINLFPTGFSFNSIFCSAASGAEFSEYLLGEQPKLINSFSGWNESLKSGNLILFNSGAYPLTIKSILVSDTYIRTSFSESEISSNSSKAFPIYYEGESAFFGTGLFNIITSAGDYSFSQYLATKDTVISSPIGVYFDSVLLYPSGTSNFSIVNNNSSGVNVEMFFDFFENTYGEAKTGFANYPNPTGAGTLYKDYLNTGFYKRVPATGGFSVFTSGSGDQYFSVEYTGNFTGIGGRLGATGVQQLTGSSEIFLTGTFSGDNPYYIASEIFVYEGDGDLFDLWSVVYNDVERGSENFKDLSRYTSSGFGSTGVTYKIPAKSKTNGVISYHNNYNESIFQSILLRLTYPTSLESSAYISAK